MQCHGQPGAAIGASRPSHGCERPLGGRGSGENRSAVSTPSLVARRSHASLAMADVHEASLGPHRQRSARFPDRTSAGVALADRLAAYRAAPDTTVVGLTNGGMVTAAAVARRLGLPLEIVLVRRLRAPGMPRRVVGAIAEDGDPHVDQEELWHHAVSADAIAREAALQTATLAQRRRRLRDGRPPALPPNGTVILVDDGLTDGLTAMAAIRALRARGVHRVVVAVPAAPAGTADRLSDMVDDLVALETPLECGAVGAFYERFPLVPDAEVRELLGRPTER
jgi:putative phosphoribosyl transferase